MFFSKGLSGIFYRAIFNVSVHAGIEQCGSYMYLTPIYMYLMYLNLFVYMLFVLYVFKCI